MSFDLDTANVVKSLILTRAQAGATLTEIKEDYLAMEGEDLFPNEVGYHTLQTYLLAIPGVTYNCTETGLVLWHVESDKTNHIKKMIQEQKPERRSKMIRKKFVKNPYTRQSNENSTYVYNRNNRNVPYNRGTFANKQNVKDRMYEPNRYIPYCSYDRETKYKSNAYLHQYQLIGDDFLLSVAKLEMGYSFKPGHKVLQSGLCISGQTISDAVARLEVTPFINNNVIVNIGSVDILHGHDLIDMQSDFVDLMTVFASLRIQPIITTLAPLANCGHSPEMREKLDKFNEFLKTNYWVCLDLFDCLVDNSKRTLYDCYQPGARYVSGSNRPHVLWNKIGRQRVLKFLKKKIGDLM